MTAFCSRHPVACGSTAIVLLTLVLTWPQGIHLGTAFAAHQDPYFSTWRIAWIAHAIATSPDHLFDGNILYPLPRTLAMSDATMLEGAIGAPLFWAGVPAVLVYNLLLLGGIAASGIGMFVLARHLTGSGPAALISAIIFTMAPYRIEHFMHLELQWTVWIPLAFWSAHRAIEERSWRFGLLTGVLIWLQVLSSIYYGVFLGMVLAVFCGLMFLLYPRHAVAAGASLMAGVILALVLLIPYARPYLENARRLGPRNLQEIASLSATVSSYLASPPSNFLWGWTAERFGAMELRLFPGLTAVALAGAGVAWSRRKLKWIWLGTALAAITFSLGLNTPVYRWLFTHVTALGGFRSPSRFAIVAMCAIAMLAGFGVAAVEQRTRNQRARNRITLAVIVLLIAEYWSAPLALVPVTSSVPAIYRYMRTLPTGVIVELPLPRLTTLPGTDPEFEFWSITHWRPLVNGYTGFFPAEYEQTLTEMRDFPSTRSYQRLRRLDVSYIIVHEALYSDVERVSLLMELNRRPQAFTFAGRYEDANGWADLFELR